MKKAVVDAPQIVHRRFLRVFELFDNTPVRIPLVTIRGPKRGPTVVIIAGVHGEEVIGVAVVLRIIEEIKLRRGTVYIIPAANMQGLSQGFRFVPLGETTKWGNLNREFPGSPNGDPTERIAYAISEKIDELLPRPSVIIDLHADAHRSIPFTLLDRLVHRKNKALIAETRALAEAFGVTVCGDDSLKEYIEDEGEKTLTGSLFNIQQRPAFVVELGGPMVVNKEFEEIGVCGVKNILYALGMLKGDWEQKIAKSKICTSYPLRTHAINAGERSGFARYEVDPGDKVAKGDRIAKIVDVFGRVKEEVRSPREGFVISLGYSAVVQPGAIIAMLAVRDYNP